MQAAICLIHVDGITRFDRPCQFLPQRGDGSFRIVAQDGWAMASVSIIRPDAADA